MMSLNEGVLELYLIEAKLTRDTELMGKMSPYVTMVFKGKKYKSKTMNSAGKTPKWNQKFVFDVTSADEDLMLRVWDQDFASSDAVGFTKIKMSSLIINMGVDAWFDIMYENKGSGTVHLKTKFEPKGGDQYAAMQAELSTQNAQLEQEAQQAKQQAMQLEQKSQQMQQALMAQQQAQAQQNAQLQAMMQKEGAQNAQVMKMQQEAQQAQAQLAKQQAEIEALKRNAAALKDVNSAGYAHTGAYQGGYGQAPPMGMAPQMQQPMYGQPQMPMQPGYGQPMMGGYQQPMQQPMMGGYQQPMQQPMMGGYQQPMMGGYQQPMQQPMGYQQPMQQPMMGGYQQPMQGQPMMGGYQQPMQGQQYMGGYQQPMQGQPPMGGYQHYGPPQ